MNLYPDESVLRIIEIRADGTPEAFLGTGFIAAPGAILVTASHVLAGRPTSSKNQLVVAIEAHDDVYQEFRPLRNIRQSTTADVAIADVDNTNGLRMLRLNRGEAPTNVDVLVVDHSSTEIIVNDGKRVMRFSGGTLKGNIVRHYVSDFGATRGRRCFDTSFPALGGASGAPVILPPRFSVAGMLVANVQRHLVPAQIVKVTDGESVIEEVHYLLPFGQALEADEITQAIRALGVPLENS